MSLIVITSDPQDELVLRNFTNKPEQRHKKIFDMLHNQFSVDEKLNVIFHIHNSLENFNTETIKSLNVHDDKMLDYLENCHTSFLQYPDKLFSDYEHSGIVPYNFTHGIIKLEKIYQLCYWRQSGHWCSDQITPIFADTFETALLSAQNCFNVKNHLSLNTRQTIYCLNVYPGHHAHYNKYGGYCFLNNGAICAKSLLAHTETKRLAILDLDHHAGDGTADIFKDNPDVITVSIHANTNNEYPYYTCEDETNNDTNNKFISFEQNCGLEKYLKHINDSIDFINRSKIDCLIIAFGADTYKLDPDASDIANCGLEISDYAVISSTIRSNFFDIPIIVTQEGGYNVTDIDKILKSFLGSLV